MVGRVIRGDDYFDWWSCMVFLEVEAGSHEMCYKEGRQNGSSSLAKSRMHHGLCTVVTKRHQNFNFSAKPFHVPKYHDLS